MSNNENKEEQQEEQQKHIVVVSPEEEHKGWNSGTGGLLSSVMDPVGNGISTVLQPVGRGVEYTVTGPLGNVLGSATRGALGPFVGYKEERIELLGGENKENEDSQSDDSQEGLEKSIGGQKQTGQNPLGLNQRQ